MGRTRGEVKRYARKLRRNQTVSERRMWGLIFLGFLAQRVTPINYVADYYNPLSRVILEIDGGIHKGQRKADAIRDERHMRRGILTVRISDTLAMHYRPIAYFKIGFLTLVWQFLRWFRF